MEKADCIYTIPAEFDWSDLGNWASLYGLLPKDEQGNAAVGNVSLDEIDYWYPVEIAENVYLSLATDYGVPVNGDLHEILGSHYDALSDKWNIMLEHLDEIVFTAENGEENEK